MKTIIRQMIIDEHLSKRFSKLDKACKMLLTELGINMKLYFLGEVHKISPVRKYTNKMMSYCFCQWNEIFDRKTFIKGIRSITKSVFKKGILVTDEYEFVYCHKKYEHIFFIYCLVRLVNNGKAMLLSKPIFLSDCDEKEENYFRYFYPNSKVIIKE